MAIDPSTCKTTAERAAWLRDEADRMERDASQNNPDEWCSRRLMSATARNLADRMEAADEQRK